MDKNSITGLLLIAAIMFGFFYLTKPKDNGRQDSTRQTTVTEQPAETSGAADVFLGADSARLVQAIRLTGMPGDDGSYLYSGNGLELTLAADGTVAGTVRGAGDSIAAPVGKVMANQGSAAAGHALRNYLDNCMRYQGLARYSGGTPQEFVLENELVKVTLSTLGARVSQVELKKYKTERGDEPRNIELFTNATDGYGFQFSTAEQRIDTRNFNFEATPEGDSAVVMTIRPTETAEWSVRYALSPDNYIVSMVLSQRGMDSYLPGSTSSMDFEWYQKLGRNEKGRTFEERNSAIYYKYVGQDPDDLDANKNEDEELTGRLRWVAFKNQFFSSVIVAREAFTSANLNSVVLKKSQDYLKDMTMDATLPYTTADGQIAAFDWYFGPNDYSILSDLDDRLNVGEDLDLTRLIPLGWTLFRWINTLIVIPVFNFLGSYIASYGIIILLLTIFIKLIIFPFTFKSYQSQAKMRVLAPEVAKINEKYPDQADALKKQQETMALYSKAGASPFSGCLPMLLQMPVLIAMFSFFPSAIELRGQSFLWAHDLSAPDTIFTLPFSIPFYGNQVSLFCLLMTIVNIIYMKVSMASQPGGASMPGMKVMMYFMPVMFLFIFNDYASGLSYYYFLSLLITIVQTWAFRQFTNEDKLRAQMAENAKKPRKKSGWMARLEEASKQAQAAQRAQQRRRK